MQPVGLLRNRCPDTQQGKLSIRTEHIHQYCNCIQSSVLLSINSYCCAVALKMPKKLLHLGLCRKVSRPTVLKVLFLFRILCKHAVRRAKILIRPRPFFCDVIFHVLHTLQHYKSQLASQLADSQLASIVYGSSRISIILIPLGYFLTKQSIYLLSSLLLFLLAVENS